MYGGTTRVDQKRKTILLASCDYFNECDFLYPF